MAYVIGVDCGTSGTKTVLFDEKGTVISSVTIEYPMYQPKNGYAEQDPADWANAMINTIKAVMTKSGVNKEDVAGVGISGQMHGLVMLDKDNNVLRKSIIWCDQRTAAVPNRCWSKEVCDTLDIDMSMLGKVYESCEVTGKVTKKMAELTGLKEGTIVVGGAGDNAAAAIGTGVAEDGKAFTTIGTSGVVFAHTSSISIDPKGRVHTCCAAVPNAWHVMGVTQGAGLSLKWFRDNFCNAEKETAKCMGVDEYYLMDKEAEKVPVGANRLLYLPYLMGERTPHLDPDARGVFFGLSAMHTKRDMLRAVMEGVSYSLRDCVEVFREMDINVSDMMACGGGGSSPLWRSMLADLYNCPVKTASSKEGPALGVALLAATGAGIYSSVPEACKAVVKTDKVQQPEAERVPEYEKYYKLYTEIYPALKAEFAKLAKM